MEWVACSLLQGIFPTQRLNPGLPHCGRILYQLSHRGNPRILEWVAFPFSRGFSQLRNWTRVFFIEGRFFSSWAISSPNSFLNCSLKCLQMKVCVPGIHHIEKCITWINSWETIQWPDRGQHRFCKQAAERCKLRPNYFLTSSNWGKLFNSSVLCISHLQSGKSNGTYYTGWFCEDQNS